MRARFFVPVLLVLTFPPVAADAGAAEEPWSKNFESSGQDRQAIEALLANYTAAVTNKDEALFETLLLNQQVPFSPAAGANKDAAAVNGTRKYESFREGVFKGPPFTQTFHDVHILQDGPLAEVSLVFVNKASTGESWGWKTMQLLKVDGHWKIASEFFTGHE